MLFPSDEPYTAIFAPRGLILMVRTGGVGVETAAPLQVGIIKVRGLQLAELPIAIASEARSLF